MSANQLCSTALREHARPLSAMKPALHVTVNMANANGANKNSQLSTPAVGVFEGEISKQVTLATEEADVILFVVDVKNGITDLDAEVATILRRTKVPVILCANKTDNNEERYGSAEFYKQKAGLPLRLGAQVLKVAFRICSVLSWQVP